MNSDVDHPNETGVIEELPVLALDVEDNRLVYNFKQWEDEARAYWDDIKGFNLKAKRKKNEDYYLGHQLDESQLYPYQVPYKQNELFVATETVTSYTTSATPSAEVLPENDNSKTMAAELEWALNVHSERYKLREKLEKAERNMYLKYVGVIKLFYDEATDDIIPRVIDPEDILLDPHCKLGENPLFIAETCKATFAELLMLFPDKEKELMQFAGYQRKTQKLLNSLFAYKEVWFTQFDKDGETECVAWYIGDVLLDKSKNPNYLYKEDGVQVTNFLDHPVKPYIFFNYMNDGSHLVDQTSPFEQAIPLQDALNKCGRQIIENADTANSILVLRSGAMPTEEAENITRDPGQVVVLNTPDGMPLSSAYGEIPPHLLPAYVMNNKTDLKNSIHSIMGTPSQFRGDNDSTANTLGENQIMLNQSSGRQDAIIRALENGLDDYYKLLVQMMKVWYKSNKKFACRDNDGKYIYVEMSRERIPDVAYVTVEHGTTMKQDKKRQEQLAMTLAQMGLIDPYNLYKQLGLKNADGLYSSLVKFKMSPQALDTDVQNNVQDRLAMIDFSCIMNGETIKGHDDVTPEHLLAHRKQLMTDKFLYAKPELQSELMNHIQQETFLLSQRAKLEMANEQGMLVDPNSPVTVEPPQPMPEQPQMPMQQQIPGGMMGNAAPGEQLMDQQMPQQAMQGNPMSDTNALSQMLG